MANKKKAMVQPSPARPSHMPWIVSPELKQKLIRTLKLLKNTRAYSVLEYHSRYAVVHFEGDYQATTIPYKNI